MDEMLSSDHRETAASGVLQTAALGKDAVPFICSRLSDRSLDERRDRHLIINSIRAMGIIRDASCTRTVIQFICREADPLDRQLNDEIFRALIRIGEPASVKALLETEDGELSDSPFETFEDRFMRNLDAVQGDETIPKVQSSLLSLLSSERDKRLRLQILNMISTLNDPQSLDALLSLLLDSEPEIRREVIKMIFQRRASEYKDHLHKALEDTDEEVRTLAIYGLLLSDRSLDMDDMKNFIGMMAGMKGQSQVKKEVESLLASFLIRSHQEAKPMLLELIAKGDKETKLLANKLMSRLD
ncbi:MAG: HEAT repeat domain-containing protein [Thermoplasmatota archaeon]